ncbi:unnamed protein product [Mesocestoides corti]|uniref:G-protein coupled receptors family 3 profile domain-containing protein n=1 Tax=Mesocestoides corti TaxID=53468 RepID=A0A3P6I4A9_MESCO|nr:unnamed protein product [Mesocestoides corti]
MVLRFTDNKFDKSTPTTFLNMPVTTTDVYGTKVKFCIYDVPGAIEYRSLAQGVYAGIEAAILCFDISNQASFDALSSWISEIKNGLPANGVKVLVGLKTDLTRQVQAEAARSFATQNDFMYIEASSKNKPKEVAEVFKLTAAKSLGIPLPPPPVCEECLWLYASRVQTCSIRTRCSLAYESDPADSPITSRLCVGTGKKGFDLKYVFLFHLFTSLIIPVYGMDQTISRARSRRLLTIISMNLHSPTSDCPEPFSSEPKADHLLQKNLSYLLPLNPNDEALLREVITPEILQNSYKRDIARAVSLAELTTSWLSTKGPMTFEGTTVTVDFKLFLEPMLRSFIQTVSYYSGNAEESGRMWGSLVQSVAICISSEPAIFVAKPQKNSQQPNSVAPSNLCTRTTEVLEGARLQPISSVNQMLGLWAPLHCNLGCTVAGRKIQLHLIFPIPHTKSLRDCRYGDFQVATNECKMIVINTVSYDIFTVEEGTLQGFILKVKKPYQHDSPTTKSVSRMSVDFFLRLFLQLNWTTGDLVATRLVFEFDLRNLTLDLCAAGLDYCRHSTTQCFYRQYRPWPFDVGNYICQCKPGFYTDRPENGYPAELLIQNQHKGGSDSEGCKIKGLDRMSCKVCPPDCPNCTSGTPCGVEYNMHLLRGIPLAIQTFSITTCLFLGILSFRVRRTRVFKAANWMFLEIFLLGAILLYSTTIVMYFRASSSTCILVPWFREVGFALMYGVLIVKLYRVLLCFQSRKAHRVHVRDKDLFKYLGCFIAIVAGYMFAWTAVSLDYTGLRNLVGFPMQTSSPGSAPVSQPGYDDILVKGRVRTVITPTPTFKSPSLVLASINSSVLPNTSVMSNRTLTTQMATPNVHYQYFRVCRAMSWDIVVQLGEFVLLQLKASEIAILLVGVHYCRLIWSAPSDYNENRCITVALLAELVGSGILYLIRPFIWYSTHPDVIFLIYFVRCHLTVSVNIGVIFGLKFWYLHKPPSPQVGGMVVGVVGGRRGMVGAVPGASAAPHLVPCNNKLRLASNGELDLADVNLADMDPEVIRRELKRLYTAIEIFKTKAMRRDNPHISKRRGGRKQRRFSLQPFHKKHHGSGVGDCTSGYQGDISTLSNAGAGGSARGGTGDGDRSTFRSATGSKGLRGSLVMDEETSRVSEESLNLITDITEQRQSSSSPQYQQRQFSASGLRVKGPSNASHSHDCTRLREDGD